MLTFNVWERVSKELEKTILTKTENVISDLKKNLEERVGLKFSEMSAVNEERQDAQKSRGDRIEQEQKRLDDAVRKLTELITV